MGFPLNEQKDHGVAYTSIFPELIDSIQSQYKFKGESDLLQMEHLLLIY